MGPTVVLELDRIDQPPMARNWDTSHLSSSSAFLARFHAPWRFKAPRLDWNSTSYSRTLNFSYSDVLDRIEQKMIEVMPV